jgi:hypothetical protein
LIRCKAACRHFRQVRHCFISIIFHCISQDITLCIAYRCPSPIKLIFV